MEAALVDGGHVRGIAPGTRGELERVATGDLRLGEHNHVGGGALLVLTRAVRNLDPAARFALRLGFALATAVLVGATFVVLSQRFEVLDLNTGPAPWIEGWLTRGGTASVVHLMLIVLVAMLVAGRERDTVRLPRTAPQASRGPAPGPHP
ncbi:hypothetical protein [Pseudoclavibacter sp. AY1H1]|uniref:hypothetical protein n=1 Tax=Pseudoclavibacter sp. AY1H1 TaxID=2080584 RepID=UPI000CE90C1D|nr:hypothetical protein [Pseudoclavibacter sp. AY1H1]PPF36130.1 hypothetical protein C5E05_11635 [Pseudoclavibacter sp. AY1H1]